MANAKAFGNRIQQIQGVKSYIFVRNDGHVIAHSMERSAAGSSDMTAFGGLSCEALKPLIGATFFKHLCLTGHEKEKFLIFPVENYFLGILLEDDAYPPDVIQRVSQFLQAVVAKMSKPS